MKKAAVFLVIIPLFLLGCSSSSNNKYVQMVKGGRPNAYPNITYEAAFSAFFSSPKWRYFESDAGKKVVEFTGKCKYQDVPVKALLQFVIDEQGGTFEAAHLSLNKIPQNKLHLFAIIEKVFDEYAAKQKR